MVILTSGKFLDTIGELSQKALDTLSIWARSKGLDVNPRKREMVLFTRRTKIPDFRRPTLNEVQPEMRPYAKYLGVILDGRLSWKLNLEERTYKANKAFYACNRLHGKKWGLKPTITRWVYTAIVRPILLYVVMVW